MLFSPLAWVLFAITLMVALPGALASPSPKRSKRGHSKTTRVTIESYPAIEGEETTEYSVPARVLPLRSSKSTGKATVQASAAAPAPMTVQVVTQDAASSERATKFETVPAEKRAQILRRIELCADLFRETGRAYDYRAMTTRELEGELANARASKPTLSRDEDNPS